VEEVNAPGRNLHDIAYLANGTPKQRRAFAAIDAVGIFKDLRTFTPALAGTIPLGIDTASSDLDIICRAEHFTEFEDRVRSCYDHHEAFGHQRDVVRGVETVLAWFWYDGWEFELFAQDVPVAEQFACLHLRVEARLLALGGEAARAAIQELKRTGMKTEPAFALYFGIEGEAYLELARLAHADEAALRAIVARVG
jgi:hypothetical protein